MPNTEDRSHAITHSNDALETPGPVIGDVISVEVGDPIAGGQCIARSNGQVVFVRDAIPGELVDVQITGIGKRGSFLRGDVVSVSQASEHRVEPPCALARECGGCDWQHVDIAFQRELKKRVVIDAMRRTGGVTNIGSTTLADAVSVEPLDSGDGLHWRTRMRYAVTDSGTVGLRAARSHTIIPASNCPLAVNEISSTVPAELPMSDPALAAGSVIAARSNTDQTFVGPADSDAALVERVRDRNFTVAARGFWQVHPHAAETLVEAVLEFAAITPGERVIDLYSGVGLFAAFLAEATTLTGRVDAVEGDKVASEQGRRNLADLAWVHHHRAPVERWLAGGHRSHADVIVLDPPRSGAGKDVAVAVARRRPRAIVYVACDPVALARDTKYLAARGYALTGFRAFDLFPMTKHIESVALFTRE